MRIAKICGSFLPRIGGLEWKAHHIATELTRLGHDVTVFTMFPKLQITPVQMPVDTSYRVIRCAYPIKGFGYFRVADWLFTRAVLRAHLSKRFDVIHTHHLGTATRIGLTIKRKTGLPVVATTCGEDVQVDESIGYGIRLVPRFDRMLRRNLDEVDAVGSISASIRQELEDLGTTAEIFDIPNGLDWETFQSGRTDYFSCRFGIDDRSTIVVSLGRNHPKKAFAEGLKAMAQVLQSRHDVYYFLCGGGVQELAPLVSSLGLEDRVYLCGLIPMEDVPNALKSADIFFNPSMLEGFAQVNVQALACGCPLVVTDAPGNRDAAEFGGAIVAKANDACSMANALNLLINNKSLREEYGAQAHKISKRFSWRVITEQYVDVYNKLLAN